MSFPINLFATLYAGLALFSILSDVMGFALCVAYRRLSEKLLIAALGFAGLIVAVVVNQFVPQILLRTLDLDTELHQIVIVIGLAIGIVARFLIVIGLWWGFAEIRRKLSLALEPRDDFR